MKNKKMYISVILLLCGMMLFAGGTNPDMRAVLSKKFSVQGGYYDFFSLNVTPLSAQSQAYIDGMPFDLEGDDIRPIKNDQGRLIATFDLISNNSDFIITVKAEPLRFVNIDTLPEQDVGRTALGYNLTFEYTISYYNNQTNNRMDGMFVIPGDGQEKSDPRYNVLYGKNVDAGTYVGVQQGRIYFQLSQQADKLLHPSSGRTSMPDGYYQGKVTIKMEVTE